MKSVVLVCRVLFFAIIASPFLICSHEGYSFEAQPIIIRLYDEVQDNGSQEDKIIGVWLTEKKDSKVQIVKSPNGSFTGKLVWVEAPHQDFTGMYILKDVTYNPESESYTCPWVYDPKLGVTAKATAKVSNDTLYLKARKGVITMNEIFTRCKLGSIK